MSSKFKIVEVLVIGPLGVEVIETWAYPLAMTAGQAKAMLANLKANTATAQVNDLFWKIVDEDYVLH